MPAKDPNRFDTIKAIHTIRDSREKWLGKNERLVLVMLVISADYHGTAWTGQDRLAKETKLGARTVWKALKNLEEHFFLQEDEVKDLDIPPEVEPGRQHHSTRYHFPGAIARLAALATLETARLAKSSAQSRKTDNPDSQKQTPDSQKEQSRLAPVATEDLREDPREEQKEKIHTKNARERSVHVSHSSIVKAERITPAWRPGAETVEWCRKLNRYIDVDKVVASFIDYWLAADKGTSPDWDARFRERVRFLHEEDRLPTQLREVLPQSALDERARQRSSHLVNERKPNGAELPPLTEAQKEAHCRAFMERTQHLVDKARNRSSVAITTPDVPRYDLLDPEGQAKAASADAMNAEADAAEAAFLAEPKRKTKAAS